MSINHSTYVQQADLAVEYITTLPLIVDGDLYPIAHRIVVAETVSGSRYAFVTDWSYKHEKIIVKCYPCRSDGSLHDSFWVRDVEVGKDRRSLSIVGYDQKVATLPITSVTSKFVWTKGAAHCMKELRTYDEFGRDGGGSVSCIADLLPDGTCPRAADHNPMRKSAEGLGVSTV